MKKEMLYFNIMVVVSVVSGVLSVIFSLLKLYDISHIFIIIIAAMLAAMIGYLACILDELREEKYDFSIIYKEAPSHDKELLDKAKSWKSVEDAIEDFRSKN